MSDDHELAQCSRRGVIVGALSVSTPALTTLLIGDTLAARSPDSALPKHLTAEAQAGIGRGLAWLAARQKSDGGFGRSGSYARNVGVCSLCGLAFLAHGGARGPYAAVVQGCADYLTAHAHTDGFIVEEDVRTHAPMYGHGFATLFLGQALGMVQRSELREVLKRAVTLIIEAQGPQGAWRYTPDPDDADVSVSTCQLTALLSARQAGISVPPAMISRSVAFLLKCQNSDGGFRYRLIDPPESLFPRSAAAVAALCMAGLRDIPAVSRGREYLFLGPGLDSPAPGHAEYFYYGRYYATWAAWQAGGATWDHWYPTVRNELLARQSAEGHWEDPNIGNEYATAMALNALQMPLDSLPMHLRVPAISQPPATLL